VTANSRPIGTKNLARGKLRIPQDRKEYILERNYNLKYYHHWSRKEEKMRELGNILQGTARNGRTNERKEKKKKNRKKGRGGALKKEEEVGSANATTKYAKENLEI